MRCDERIINIRPSVELVTVQSLTRILRKTASQRFSAFTLVELIVVITILAILATIGFLALSGYSQDAKDASISANVRSVRVAIESESAITGNSPRYYVVHDSDYALSWAFVYVDGNQVALTGGTFGEPDTNYSAGNPDYGKLKMDPKKFRTSSSPLVPLAHAAGEIYVGAMETFATVNNKRRSVGYLQVAGIAPATGKVTIDGNYPPSSWSVAWLIKNPAPGSSWTGALTEGAITPQGELPAKDGEWNNVSLLVHGNGVDGASIQDVTGKNVPFAMNGLQVAGSQWKFGNWSLYFDGTNDYFYATGTTFVSGTEDFTVEGWIRPSSFAGSSYGRWIFTIKPSAASTDRIMFRTLNGSAVLNLYSAVSGSAQFGTSGTNASGGFLLVTDTWYHVALVRSAWNFKAYVNGVERISVTNQTTHSIPSSSYIEFWRNTDGSVPYFNGYANDFRVTRGIARYTSDFSASLPAAPFPNQ